MPGQYSSKMDILTCRGEEIEYHLEVVSEQIGICILGHVFYIFKLQQVIGWSFMLNIF
ncbi:unnamed protein product [marine sediment metagenome]|uniref:Uncharacterized protein n=1 Tax=marine sediment metagenome TaxID=412755 RepID=X1UYE7_9ZZZZ